MTPTAEQAFEVARLTAIEGDLEKAVMCVARGLELSRTPVTPAAIGSVLSSLGFYLPVNKLSEIIEGLVETEYLIPLA